MTRLLRGLGALALLLGLVVGFPLLLALWVGWPLPRHVPTWDELTTLMQSQIPSAVVIGVLACLCWLAWAHLCVAVTGELVAQIRGSAVRLPGLTAPLQHLVAPLVASLVLALSSHNLRQAPARSGVAAPPVQLSAEQHSLGGAGAGAAAESGGAVRVASTLGRAAVPTQLAPSAVRTDPYTVRRGDSMWKLAARRYGAGAEWLRIWYQNRGRAEPNGRHLTNPSLIGTGWGLDIPVAGAEGASPSALGPATAAPVAPGNPVTAPQLPVPAAPGPAAEPTFRLTPSQATLAPTNPRATAPSTGFGGAAAQAPAATGAASSVLLPLGGTVGISLALAVAAVVARARVQERRRWRPGATPGQVDELITPTIERLQRAARAATGGRPLPVLEELLEDVPGRILIGPSPPPTWPLAADSAEAGEAPERRPDCESREIPMDIDRLAGLALDGPGGQAALRALVASMLTAHGEYGVEVVLVGAAARLLQGAEAIPGVRVEPDHMRAVAAFEQAFAYGTRVLLDRGVQSCTEIAPSDCPIDIWLMVVAAEDDAARYWGMRAPVEWEWAGRRGVAVLCAGTADGFTAVTVGADGAIDAAARARLGGAEHLRLLGVEEGADVFAVIAASRETRGEATELESEPPAGPVDDRLCFPRRPVSTAPDARPVDLRLLGRPRLLVEGVEVASGVPARGLYVLARLALKPDGLSTEELLDSVWDADGEAGAERHALDVVNSRTRVRLGELAGTRLAVVGSDARGWRLDVTEVDVDVWRFEQALDDARRATAAGPRRAALARAVAELDGPPLDGLGMNWAEAVAQRLRGRALDVLVELADLEDSEGDLEPAIALLEKALAVDPCAEHVVRRLMDLEERCGRAEAADRTYRQLLAELRALGLTMAEEETERKIEAIRVRARTASRRRLASAGRAPLSIVCEARGTSDDGADGGDGRDSAGMTDHQTSIGGPPLDRGPRTG